MDRLTVDEALGPGQSIQTPNGRASLVMQSAGDLVLYQLDDGVRTILWSTVTDRPGSRLMMQGDGNLALYGPGGDCRWATGTDGNPGAWLALQDDGNLVVYGPDGSVLWASGTQLPPAVVVKGDRLLSDQVLEPSEALESPNRRALLVMQRDGNLVLYQVDGESRAALWATGTDVPGARVAMQADGNLALYEPAGSCRWATGTEGSSGAWLALQDDGNLVIYATDGPALWASGTQLAN